MVAKPAFLEPTYKARRHDKAVIAHLLARPCAGVFGDPGVGKSGQTLATFHVLKKKNLIDKLLIVAPLNPIHQSWPGEIHKWGFPYRMVVLHGAQKDRLLNEDVDIFGINYDGLGWLSRNIERLLSKGKRWWMVLDESHRVKRTNTQRFKSLKPLLPLFGRRTILTGTPRPNGLEDLFGQVYCLDLGESLGKYITHFRREYFYPSGYGGYDWQPQEGAEQKVYEKLKGMLIRVDEKVLDLPPINDVPLPVRLPESARKIYKDLEREFVAELESATIIASNAGVKSAKLRQIANGFLYDGEHAWHGVHDAKIEAVLELLEALDSPLLIGYEFEADAQRLSKALKGAPIVGEYSASKRPALFGEFNAGKIPVLLAQTGSVSLGVNLQEACHHVAFFGLTWKLDDYIQFRKRVHRAGQKRSVTVHHIVAENSIEDKVMWPVLNRKDTGQLDFFLALKKAYLVR